MTVVDPMKPVVTRRKVNRSPTPVQQKTIVAKSMVLPAPPSAPRKRVTGQPVTGHQVKHDKKSRPWLKITAIVLFVISLFVLPEFLSQLLLIGYAVFVIIRRVVVGLTFGIAILLLLLSPLFTLITGNTANGAVLASYSFGLLLVGFVQLIVEYRRTQRQ